MRSNFRSNAGHWTRMRVRFANAPIPPATVLPIDELAPRPVPSASHDNRNHPVLRGMCNVVVPSALLWAGILYLCFG